MSGSVTVSTEYREHLMTSLYTMYEQQQFCDLELKADQGESFHVHKAIVTAASSYLRTIVEKEAHTDQQLVCALPSGYHT